MPHPDHYSATLADSAMGSTREADRQADAREVRALLERMQEIVDELRASPLVSWTATDKIEAGMGDIWRAL